MDFYCLKEAIKNLGKQKTQKVVNSWILACLKVCPMAHEYVHGRGGTITIELLYYLKNENINSFSMHSHFNRKTESRHFENRDKHHQVSLGLITQLYP